MQVTTRAVRNWADEGGIPDMTLAELDFRLVHALQAVYADPLLCDRLYLKGGTALNKLYLPGANRLSVDLDFNAIGRREQVLRERTPIGEAVAAVLRQQDPRYDLTYRWRYDQVTLYARYAPLTGGAPQRIKLEISFIERFAILGKVERPLLLALLDEPVVVHTFRLEELVSTKLRALFDRRKGRDIYDLYRAAGLDLDRPAVRKMVLYYFLRANKVFHYPTFVSNVERKIAERGFSDDIRGLIRLGSDLDWQEACSHVLDFLSFLGELDERDVLFLDMAKYLLHKPYPGTREEQILGIVHPLAWLMEGLPISDEARAVTQEEMRPYLPAQNE